MRCGAARRVGTAWRTLDAVVDAIGRLLDAYIAMRQLLRQRRLGKPIPL
jgi:hypothetical protein